MGSPFRWGSGPTDAGLWHTVADRLNPSGARPVLRSGIEVRHRTAVRGGRYVMLRSPDTQALMAALEVAKKSNEQLIQARQGEQLAMKELEEAKKREAEAKASGDVAKQQQLAEETKRREAELQRQGDLERVDQCPDR